MTYNTIFTNRRSYNSRIFISSDLPIQIPVSVQSAPDGTFGGLPVLNQLPISVQSAPYGTFGGLPVSNQIPIGVIR